MFTTPKLSEAMLAGPGLQMAMRIPAVSVRKQRSKNVYIIVPLLHKRKVLFIIMRSFNIKVVVFM